jgi:hypothetical protein
MTRMYSLNDPELDEVMRELAVEVAVNWPPLDDIQRAQLAPLLADPKPRPAPISMPARRAA